MYFLRSITKRCLTIIVVLVTQSAQATNDNAYISHHLNGDTLIVKTTKGNVAIDAYANSAFSVHYLIENKHNTAADLPSFSIKEDAISQRINVTDNTQQLILSLGKLTAVIDKTPFQIHYYQEDKLLLSEKFGFFTGSVIENNKKHNVQGFRFTLSEHEKLLGGGERVLGMDRRGHRMPLYNRAHYGYETHSNQMNFSLPAVLSSNKYILLFDNSAKGWMDLGKSQQNIMQFEAVSGRMSYIVFAGDSYPELIKSYVDVTGTQPMPPRWALGNYASRFGYRNEKEVRDTVNKFVELDIPLDALILDLYWFGKDIKGHMGNLDWDNNTFPRPRKMINDLKAQGVNTILITEPFVLSSSKKWADAVQHNALAKSADGTEKRFDFYFGNTGLIDVFNPKSQQWFNEIYNTLYQYGIAGWWGDLGEPEVHPSDTLHTLANGSVVNADAIHNVYGHQWAKMVYENQLALSPNERPFILMRSGAPGSQRYGMTPWTGDVNRTWGGLKPQVELSLQMGVLGMGYTHSDLGGFAGGESFNKEMYIRWLQYGVFQPIYRPHAQDNIASEVVYHDKETQDILREFIKLRYKLMPYNYTLAYQNSTTGMPLMRPLFFEDENNIQLIDNATSYLWGDAFLVTPVVSPNTSSVSIPLPKGIWFNYFTNERYIGDQNITVATPLETLPVLVRAGSFIPMTPEIQSTQDYNSKNLTLHYYADKTITKSSGEMYEDDGRTFHADKKQQFELLSFTAEHSNYALNITLARSGKGYKAMPSQRNITLVIHNVATAPKMITVGKQQIDNFTWQKDQQTLSIKLAWQHQPLTLEIQK